MTDMETAAQVEDFIDSDAHGGVPAMVLPPGGVLAPLQRLLCSHPRCSVATVPLLPKGTGLIEVSHTLRRAIMAAAAAQAVSGKSADAMAVGGSGNLVDWLCRTA